MLAAWAQKLRVRWLRARSAAAFSCERCGMPSAIAGAFPVRFRMRGDVRDERRTFAALRKTWPPVGSPRRDVAPDADNPTLLQVLVLERVDRARNMARFYVLSIEPTLFEDLALVRRWGRIGSAGRERIDLHPSRRVAQIELEKWLDRKRRRGYQLRA